MNEKWRLINLTSTFYKKLGLVLILAVILTAVVGCDNIQDTEKGERVYLNLGATNTYGVETLNPGEGRFIYDKNAVAEIEFASAEGYNFLGWEGEDKEALTEESDGHYKLKMNEDREIKANLELVDFKPLEVNFSGIDPVKYSELGQVTNVPHNLEDVSIKFNNELHTDNELVVRIVENENNNEDQVDSSQIEIADNKINITVADWIDRFYSDDSNDSYLKFGKEYTLHVETNNNDNISYQKQLKILRNLPAEQLRVIIITASSEKEVKSGYHTSIKTAKKLSGENVDFRVTIISPKNTIITQSNETIDIENIKSIIQNFNN